MNYIDKETLEKYVPNYIGPVGIATMIASMKISKERSEAIYSSAELARKAYEDYVAQFKKKHPIRYFFMQLRKKFKKRA